MSDPVVGDKDCEIDDVVEILFDSKSTSGLIDNWKLIARELKLPAIKLNALETKKKNEEPIVEIWTQTLEAWVNTKGEEAKVSVLIGILSKAKYTTRDAADKLKGKYGGSGDGGGSGSTESSAGASGVPSDSKAIAHIKKHLPSLISRTQVNISLTSTLVSLGVFADDDICDLDAQLAANTKANKFYEIIIKKYNFYPHLITALEAGNQSGAVAILKSI